MTTSLTLGRSIRFTSIGSISLQLMAAGISLLTGVYLVHLMSFEEFGQYVVVYTVAAIAAIPASFGIPTILARYIAQYESEGALDRLNGILRWSDQRAMAAISFVSLAILFAGLVAGWSGFSVGRSLVLAAMLIPLMSATSVRAGRIRGNRAVLSADLIDYIFRPAIFLASVALWTTLGGRPRLTAIIVLQLLAYLTELLVAQLMIWRCCVRPNNRASYDYDNRQWASDALCFAINDGTFVLRSRLLTALIAGIAGYEAVGLFEVASRAADILVLPLIALTRALAPFVAAAWGAHDLEKVERIMKLSSRLALTIALAGLGLYASIGDGLLAFTFGEPYRSAIQPLLILCAGQLFNSATGALGLLFAVADRSRYLVLSNLGALAILVSTAVPLIRVDPVSGGAYAQTIALIVQNVLLWWVAIRSWNVDTLAFGGRSLRRAALGFPRSGTF